MAIAKTPSKSAEYRVEIQPLAGRPKLEHLLAEAEQTQGELEAVLQDHIPGARLRIRRAEEFPLHHLLTLALQIDWSHVRHVVTDAVLGAAVKDLYDRLSHKLDASVQTAASLPASSAAEIPVAKRSRTNAPAKKKKNAPRKAATPAPAKKRKKK